MQRRLTRMLNFVKVPKFNGRISHVLNKFYINLEYTVHEARKESFYKSIISYLQTVKHDSLHVDMCGIRPKLQGPGEEYRDFVVKKESDGGYPGLINLIGIESPGLTSCIPIAHHVSSLIEQCIERC